MSGEGRDQQLAPKLTIRGLAERVGREFVDGSGKIATFLAIAVPLHCVYGGLSLLFSTNFGDSGFHWDITQPGVSFGQFTFIVSVLALITLLVISYWLTSTMLRRDWRPEFDKLPAWIALLIVSNLMIGLGFFLLVIPGVILAIGLTPILPLVIMQETTIDMISDTFERSLRSFLPICVVGLAINLPYLLLLMIAEGFYWVANNQVYPMAWIATGAVHCVFTALNICLSIAAFRMLLGDVEQDSEVFA